jgi:glycolate oxidase iron-sulfur subunit
MAGFEILPNEAPKQADLDKCVHCGLCLNACPTYRELGYEMDSPRGRIYQMVEVASGKRSVDEEYVHHMETCLACRGCETACPSGVEYGKLIEAARADIEQKKPRPFYQRWFRTFVFEKLLPSPTLLKLAGWGLYAYQKTGLQEMVRNSGVLKWLGLANVESLSPSAQMPSFFDQYGKVFPAEGERRYKVALLGGCMANVCFTDLHQATVRVLQKNGCEVHVPPQQTCCGALAVHAGEKQIGRQLARTNIDALIDAGFDALITNTAGCGSTLKEYHHLLEDDLTHKDKSKRFVTMVKDVNQWLVEIGFRPPKQPIRATVTYQDSCHLLHGQKIKSAPRQILKAIPGLEFRELPQSDICCGSAGIYNVLQNEMAMELLTNKMRAANSLNTHIITSANPGCLLQLQAGVRLHGTGQQVCHVIELLDQAYRAEKS